MRNFEGAGVVVPGSYSGLNLIIRSPEAPDQRTVRPKVVSARRFLISSQHPRAIRIGHIRSIGTHWSPNVIPSPIETDRRKSLKLGLL